MDPVDPESYQRAAEALENLRLAVDGDPALEAGGAAIDEYMTEAMRELERLKSSSAHYSGESVTYHRQAAELNRELIELRGKAARVEADLLAVTAAAHALRTAAIRSTLTPELAAALETMEAALDGKMSAAAWTRRQESAPLEDVRVVLYRMFRRMKTPEKLAKAAETWVLQQLRAME